MRTLTSDEMQVLPILLAASYSARLGRPAEFISIAEDVIATVATPPAWAVDLATTEASGAALQSYFSGQHAAPAATQLSSLLVVSDIARRLGSQQLDVVVAAQMLAPIAAAGRLPDGHTEAIREIQGLSFRIGADGDVYDVRVRGSIRAIATRLVSDQHPEFQALIGRLTAPG